MYRLIFWVFSIFSFTSAWGQSPVNSTSVLYNVEKELNAIVISRSEKPDSSAYTALVIKKCKSIQAKLNCLRGNLTNVSNDYLASIDFNAKLLSTMEPLPDSLIVSTLIDIENDLDIKCKHRDLGLGIKNYYPDKVQFKIRTVRLVNSSGRTIDAKGYKVKANYWRYRNNPIPQYNFNDQITNPSIEITLEPGEYDIWVESIVHSKTGHVMAKKVVNYSIINKEITIVVDIN